MVCLDEKTAVPVRTPRHAETRGPDGTRRREFEHRRAGTISWYGIQDVATGAVDLHPGVEVLFTPFHASWANPVEVQLSILTRQVITGGRHTSGEPLDAAAQHWTRLRNRHHRPVRWSYQRRGPRAPDPQH